MPKSYIECSPQEKVEVLCHRISESIKADPAIGTRISGFISTRSGGAHSEVEAFAKNGTAPEKKLEALECIFKCIKNKDWTVVDAASPHGVRDIEADPGEEEDEETKMIRDQLEALQRLQRIQEEAKAKKKAAAEAAAAAAAAKPATPTVDEGRIKALITEALAGFTPATIELTPALCGVIEAHAKGVINGTVRDIIGTGATASVITTATKLVVAGARKYKPDASYVVNPEFEAEFESLLAAARLSPQNMAVVGPHGCGKTEMAIQLAARNGRPIYIMDCANVREARDWWGHKTANAGSTGWHRSQFDIAVSEGLDGEPCIILLDEFNRVSEHIKNTLYPMLDARRETYVDEKGDFIRAMPGTIFVATYNEGNQYTGTGAQDCAMSDRFTRRLEVNYLTAVEEAGLLVKRSGIKPGDAEKLVDVGDTVRRKCAGYGSTLTRTISTRQLIAASHNFVARGAPGLRSTILNHFSPDGGKESEREQVKLMLLGKFPMLDSGKSEEADEPKLA